MSELSRVRREKRYMVPISFVLSSFLGVACIGLVMGTGLFRSVSRFGSMPWDALEISLRVDIC